MDRRTSIWCRAAGAMIGAGLLACAPAGAGELGPKASYLLNCSGCHGADGTGAEKAGIPPFPRFVGPLVADDSGRTYLMHVPGVVGTGLTDREIAAVLNYVVQEWGDGPSQPFTAEEVARRRAEPVPDLIAYRRALVSKLSANGIALATYPWP